MTDRLKIVEPKNDHRVQEQSVNIDRERAAESLEQRLCGGDTTLGRLQTGVRVLITERTFHQQDVAGMYGEVLSVDPTDATAPINVRIYPNTRWTDGMSAWVYAAVRAIAPEHKDAEIARLQQDLVDAQESAARSADVLERFRDQVRQEALDVADRQGWCDQGLNETLERLDLPRKVPFRAKFKVWVQLDVQATRNGPTQEPNADFIQSSIEGVGLEMDGDWEDVAVNGYVIERVGEIENARG